MICLIFLYFAFFYLKTSITIIGLGQLFSERFLFLYLTFSLTVLNYKLPSSFVEETDKRKPENFILVKHSMHFENVKSKERSDFEK